MTKGMRVRVVNDWFDTDGKKGMAIIDNFQFCGKMKFAQLRWVGKAADTFAEKYGVLFPLDELRKV